MQDNEIMTVDVDVDTRKSARHNVLRRVVCATLALSMAFSGLFFFRGGSAVSVYAAKKEDLEEFKNNSNVKKIQSNISDLEKKQKEIKEKMSSLNDSVDDILEKKSYYEELEEITSNSIAETEKLIEEYSAQIEALSDSIDTNVKDSEDLYEQTKERIRIAYESGGGATYLELIFGAESITDFLIGLDNAVRLLDYDTALMQSYKDTKEVLEEERLIQEQNLADQEAAKESLETQRADAAAIVKESEDELAKVKNDIKKNEEMLEKNESDLQAAAKRLDSVIEELIKQRGVTQKVAEGEYMWPLPTKYTTITSSFGRRKDPFGSGKIGNHTGTDIYAPKGTSIYASNNGTVVKAEKDSSYGNYVLIDHGGNIYTLYAHASKLLVKVGDKVKKGDVIAEVGMTGSATGYHLHIEFREGTKRVDAMGYLKKP